MPLTRTDLDICYCGDFRRDHKYGTNCGGCWCGCPGFTLTRTACLYDIYQQTQLETLVIRELGNRPWGYQ